ncbi:MAG: DUF459 domain-containing protein [Ancalomicrobiaceae bacterium]|nr:DUF459 domain-containing protein [Ancalomicrobiaceae bacterium]
MTAEPGRARAEDPVKIRIAFEGDSMVDGVWEGMARYAARDACLKQVFEFGRFAKNSTGLTRVDKFNWPEESRRIAESYKPDLVVVMMGLNDRQSVVEPDKSMAAWGSAQWSIKYGEEVRHMLEAAASARAGVLWLGVPALREAEANDDAGVKNKLYAAVISAFGDKRVAFVAPWRLNPTGEEVFKSIGPDLKGNVVQIRLNDGEHFTTAGHDLLGSYMFPKVIDHLASNGVKLPEDCHSH